MQNHAFDIIGRLSPKLIRISQFCKNIHSIRFQLFVFQFIQVFTSNISLLWVSNPYTIIVFQLSVISIIEKKEQSKSTFF